MDLFSTVFAVTVEFNLPSHSGIAHTALSWLTLLFEDWGFDVAGVEAGVEFVAVHHPVIVSTPGDESKDIIIVVFVFAVILASDAEFVDLTIEIVRTLPLLLVRGNKAF